MSRHQLRRLTSGTDSSRRSDRSKQHSRETRSHAHHRRVPPARPGSQGRLRRRPCRPGSPSAANTRLPMTTVNANGVALGIESFGDDDAPLVLLAGGTTMLSWPDALCERLAAGGRRVGRYDLRDSGETTTRGTETPAYTLRDLAADAAAPVHPP